MATAPPPITHVSDTARWVAVYRAMESERPDALFRDPHARRLAGDRGAEIVRRMPRGRAYAWPMIVRTAVMDEIILRVVGGGVDTVLNLAAGLDVRPFRLALPAALRWIDVDFSDVLDYKREVLGDVRATCRYEPRPADLADAAQRRAVLAAAAGGARSVLVVTEGLLVYLEPAQVADLGRDLAAQRAFAWWLTDLGSPRLLKMLARTWGDQLARGGAPFRFAPAEGSAFFAPLGWREVEFRSMWDESLRLKRSIPFARFWSLIGRLYPARKQEEFRRMSGMLLLERAA
jgi:methyltransferase (TIGR00027 family)